MSSSQLNIVADAHIWGVRSAFSHLPGYACCLNTMENRDITPAAMKDADVLLVRSGTKVNRTLLENSSVRFVATATIGDDHVDKEYLNSRGIAFASAAGSSTGSVLEYMVAALFELRARGLVAFSDERIGVVGAGRIGGRVGRICSLFGMQVMVNDPPRQRSEGGDGFHTLDELLESADILTLHTPLIREGEDCTLHLLGAGELKRFRGKGIINAARGECIDNTVLAEWLDGDAGRWAVLDCWESEPNISRRLLAHPGVVIATPHIAGHSLDGKAANTQFVCDALCRYLNIAPAWSMTDDLPEVSAEGLVKAVQGDALERISQVVSQLYPIARDSEELKTACPEDDAGFAAQFVRLRRHYHVRRGWGCYDLRDLFGTDVPANMERLWRIVEAMDE